MSNQRRVSGGGYDNLTTGLQEPRGLNTLEKNGAERHGNLPRLVYPKKTTMNSFGTSTSVLSCHPTDHRRQLGTGSTGVKYATGCAGVHPQAPHRNMVTAGKSPPSTLSPKGRVLKIGTWNVRGMLKPGKAEIIEREMERYGLDVLGLSETHLKDNGHNTGSTGCMKINSGNQNSSFSGVGFIVSKETKNKVLGYNTISDRIITLKLEARPHPVHFIQVYAPTAQSTEEEIERFYCDLGTTYQSIPSKEMTIIMGDLNAKIGSTLHDDHQREVVGKFGLGTRNCRGEMLLEFCAEHSLCITNSCFQQHPRRLWTWKSPRGHKNQIDYIIIGKRWRSSVLSTKARPGADCGSDHQLLAADVKIRLKVVKKAKPKKALLLPKCAEQHFENLVQENLSQMDFEIFESSESAWTKLKTAVENAAKTTGRIRNKENPKSDWMTDTTWSAVKERRILKLQCSNPDSQQRYSELNSRVQRLCREDRNAHINSICSEIETNAKSSHTRDMFQMVKLLTREHKSKSWAVEDEMGHLIQDKNLILNRWREYCQQLYSSDASETPDERLDYIESEPDVLIREVEDAIARLKMKASGGDGITAQLLKHLGSAGTRIMHSICMKVWRTGQWPEDWTESIVLPLHKKGSTRKCENYRTISLISHAGKILLHIIKRRLDNYICSQIAKEQAGFVKGRGTREQILNIRQLIEKSREFNVPMALCFIDYAKAFDCISWPKMFEVMGAMGVPDHLIYLVQNLYLDGRSRVRVDDALSEPFSTERGVRQGCILSPQLFNLVGEHIMRRVLDEWEGGIRIGGHRINNLRFADDTTLIGSSETELAQLLRRLEIVSAEYGLKINKDKTKLMFVDRPGSLQRSSELRDLDIVQEFVYLGSLIRTDGDCEKEVVRRAQMAKAAVKRLERIWRNRNIYRSTKIRLMRTLVFSIFLYASETWTVKKRVLAKIDAFEMWCWRKMLSIKWTARRTNASILAELHIKTRLSTMWFQRTLSFFGHVARRNPDSFERLILVGHMEGRRSRGRKPTRWIDAILEYLQCNTQTALHLARDRLYWRALTNRATCGGHDPQP